MLVAVIEDDLKLYCVYIGVVPGVNHEQEWMEVRKHGNFLPFNEMKAMWPGLADQMATYVYAEDL